MKTPTETLAAYVYDGDVILDPADPESGEWLVIDSTITNGLVYLYAASTDPESREAFATHFEMTDLIPVVRRRS